MWYYWWRISDVDMQEHWQHCLLWFRHHVPQEEEETPGDLGSTELWAPCPHFIWSKRGQVCWPATSMAEHSRHTEAPQAGGRSFKDHEDATPAHEGKRGRLLLAVPWGAPKVRQCFHCPICIEAGPRVGSARNSGGSRVSVCVTLSFCCGDSIFISNKDSSILHCSNNQLAACHWKLQWQLTGPGMCSALVQGSKEENLRRDLF